MSLSRAADLLLCLSIGLAVVALIVLWAFLFPDVKLNLTWFRFGGFTLVTWLGFVQLYWHARRSPGLWVVLILALIMHTVIYSILLTTINPWPGIAYLFTLPAEAMAIAYVIWREVHVLPGPRRGATVDHTDDRE